MSNPTPIYTEALREAKRRTRKHSDERRVLVEMDERTAPEPAGRATGPHLHFDPPVVHVGPAVPPGAVRDLQAMRML